MFSSEIQKIANDVQRIANSMNGESGSGSSSGGGSDVFFIESVWDETLETSVLNKTFSEIAEAFQTKICYIKGDDNDDMNNDFDLYFAELITCVSADNSGCYLTSIGANVTSQYVHVNQYVCATPDDYPALPN